MFTRFNKLIAYTLIVSLLSGACSFPSLTVKAGEEQSAPVEAVQEESYDSSDSDSGSDDSWSDDSSSDDGGSDDSGSDDSGSDDGSSDNSGSDNSNSEDSGSDDSSSDNGGSIDSSSDDSSTDDNGPDNSGSGTSKPVSSETRNEDKSGNDSGSASNAMNDNSEASNNGSPATDATTDKTNAPASSVTNTPASSDAQNGSTPTTDYDEGFSGEGYISDGNGGWYDSEGNWYGNGQIGWYDDSGNWHEGWYDSAGNWHAGHSTGHSAGQSSGNGDNSGEGSTGAGSPHMREGWYDSDGNWNPGQGQSQNSQPRELDPTKINIAPAQVTLETTNYEYNGNAPHPEVTVTMNGATLSKDVDYSVFYDESPDVGTHAVTIYGTGDYTGAAHAMYTIGKRPQNVTGKPSYTKHMGDDFFRLEVATDGDGTMMFSSNNERVIDMSHTGRAYIKGTGTAVISIYAEETKAWKKSNVLRVTITVLKKEQKLTGATSYTKSLETDPFDIKLTKEGNGKLMYESSNRNVATVSRNGKVTVKGVGSAKITVYAAETATCMESTAKTITIKVGPRKTELTGILAGEDNKARVAWEKQEGVSGYQIQYSDDQYFARGKVVTADASDTSAVISGLADDAYYVRLRAYKAQDGNKLYAEWSDVQAVGAATAGNRIGAGAAGNRIGAGATGNRIGATAAGSTIGVSSNGAIGTAGTGNKISVATAGSATGVQGSRIDSSSGGKIAPVPEPSLSPGLISQFEYREPEYSTVLTRPDKFDGNAFSMSITNSGKAVMRVYSDGVKLSNGIGGLFDRDLYIAAEDGTEQLYVDIQPGETAEVRFHSVDNGKLRYGEKTKVCYDFSYDGMRYSAVSSGEEGTSYSVQDHSADNVAAGGSLNLEVLPVMQLLEQLRTR